MEFGTIGSSAKQEWIEPVWITMALSLLLYPRPMQSPNQAWEVITYYLGPFHGFSFYLASFLPVYRY